MPADEQTAAKSSDETPTTTTTTATVSETLSSEAVIEQERSNKILAAKELYSHGSRNFLVKSYAEAADELSQVCALYEELHGELSDELGMPYLLYAKSLIALALDENKVIDVPDEEEDEDDEDEEENAATEATESANGASNASGTNGTKLESIKEDAAADSTVVEEKKSEKPAEEVSTAADKAKVEENKTVANGEPANGKAVVSETTAMDEDDEKPSTSNGEAVGVEDEEENEAASNLQLAWEILELSAKIFSRQGERGLPNLAEVQTELANIEFENNILESARDDYGSFFFLRSSHEFK